MLVSGPEHENQILNVQHESGSFFVLTDLRGGCRQGKRIRRSSNASAYCCVCIGR